MALSKTDIEDLAKVFAGALNQETKAPKKKKSKFVLIVDGKVQAEMAKSMEEINEAVTAITIAYGGKAPAMYVAEVTNKIEVSLPTVATAAKGV